MTKPKSEEVLKGENKIKKPRIKKTDGATPIEAENNVIGREVHGIVDGSFDAGYLLTVRVDGSPLVLRGVVFEPGLFVPLSSVNDIAPKVKMLAPNENVAIPSPKQPNGLVISPHLSPKEGDEPKIASQSKDSSGIPNVKKNLGSFLEEERETLREEHPVIEDDEISVGKECIDTNATPGPAKNFTIADQMTIEPMHTKECGCEENYRRADQMNIDSTLTKEMGSGEKSLIAVEMTVKHMHKKEMEPEKNLSVSHQITIKPAHLMEIESKRKSLIDDQIPVKPNAMHPNKISTNLNLIVPEENSFTADEMAVKPADVKKNNSPRFVDQMALDPEKIPKATDPKGVMLIDSNGEENKIQEQKEIEPLVTVGSRDNDRGNLFRTETTSEATEQEFLDVWHVNHGDRCLEDRGRQLMLIDSNEEEKKFQEVKVGQLMAMGCGDHNNSVPNLEENSFGREIPKTAEQEFIDVWQVNHGERCLEARERELMTVVEAHLCGLGATGAEYTWTKSITDGMDLSGNISDTDGQPNDSLFG